MVAASSFHQTSPSAEVSSEINLNGVWVNLETGLVFEPTKGAIFLTESRRRILEFMFDNANEWLTKQSIQQKLKDLNEDKNVDRAIHELRVCLNDFDQSLLRKNNYHFGLFLKNEKPPPPITKESREIKRNDEIIWPYVMGTILVASLITTYFWLLF